MESGENATLEATLRLIVQMLAEADVDAVTMLEAARAADIETRNFDRDAFWQDPAQRALLQRTLVAAAAANGRLLQLLRALYERAPGMAGAIEAILTRHGRLLAQRVGVDPDDMRTFPLPMAPPLPDFPEPSTPQDQWPPKQQAGETVSPPPATRGDEGDNNRNTRSAGDDALPDHVPAGDHFETLRLDTAVPERVFVKQAFTLAVAVRQSTSPVLMRDGLPVTGSGGVDVFWPEGAAFVTLRIRISAPDCTIHGSKSDTFRLQPGRDSPDFLYHLTPKRTGPISIFVTVYQEEERLGTAGVDTTAADGQLAESAPAAAPQRTIVAAMPEPPLCPSRRVLWLYRCRVTCC